MLVKEYTGGVNLLVAKWDWLTPGVEAEERDYCGN